MALKTVPAPPEPMIDAMRNRPAMRVPVVSSVTMAVVSKGDRALRPAAQMGW
jgi:hypothetical protein